MNDEVGRLRNLRKAALRARGLAKVLRDSPRRDSLLSRSGLLCWRIARIATGRLRAHPYEEYQRGPSWRDNLNDGASVLFFGVLAKKQKRRVRLFVHELKQVARVLDDVRSLTLSADLSDSLGRAQAHMRVLLEQLEVRARLERGNQSEVQPDSTTPIGEVSTDSPYLAL